jgi:Flp pilus assembly protein TadG
VSRLRVGVARGGRRPGRGQTLVEFALGITMFLALLIGVIDMGRAVYQLNAVSQAAREIARVTSVHPGATLGGSAETAAVIAAQRRMVPGLSVGSYACVDLAGAAVAGSCLPGNWVRVTVTSEFNATLPILAALGTIDLTSSSSAEIE